MLTRHQGLVYLILTMVLEVNTDSSSHLLWECRFTSSSRGRMETSEMQTGLGLHWELYAEHHAERMAIAALCHWVERTRKGELKHKRTFWEQMLTKGEGRAHFPDSGICYGEERMFQLGRKINQICPVSVVLYLWKSQAESKGVPGTHTTPLLLRIHFCYYCLVQGHLLLWLLQLLYILINWSP